MTRDNTADLPSNEEDTILFEKISRECILFPTYARRDPEDETQWIIKTKAWALSHNSSVAKQKMMMGITKSVAGKSSADSKSSRMFEQRFKYFLATNKRFKPFMIQAIGITTLENARLEQQQTQDSSQLQQAMINHQTLFLDSLNMLSTRFNQMITTTTNYGRKLASFQSENICFPITPPTDESDDEEEEDDDWLHNTSYFPENTTPVSRPTNPISSVLDGDNRSTSTHSNNSIRTIETLEETKDCSVHLKTKSSGFLAGQFKVPHEVILNWAQNQNQCDARLIRIQSVCTDNNNKFSPNYGVVNLIEPTGISIISDIDDTIKDTRILAGARTVLSKTFFELPQGVSGMSDAYMAWYTQGASFHYVSNSPFQLMPMLDRFLRDSQFPPGSMHLRDDGKLLSRLVETPGQAKRDAILKILADFPQRHFVLIGDSGEIDLEIYTRIASEYPDQILKIYIRDVTTPDAKSALRKKQQHQQTQQRRSSSLTSLFHTKRRSVSTPLSSRSSSLTSEELESDSSESKKKKKFRSPLGMRRAVTTTLAEYAVEPRLTGHRNTVHIETKQNQGEEDEDQGLLDPHRHQKKISAVEACAQLYQRVERARLLVPEIDIVLFQDADVLSADADIQNALWNMWDDLSNNSDEATNSDSLLSSSPTTVY